LPDEQELKQELKAYRMAEILIPQELDLLGLQEIHCRSKAEKDTLLYQLPKPIRDKWQARIFSDGRRYVFYKRWTYVDSVSLGKNNIHIRFSPDTTTPGPFLLQLKINPPVGLPLRYEDTNFNTRTNGAILPIRLPTTLLDYEFTITLDNNLAYKNRFIDYDVPF
jgi:hypothetical protein